MQLARLGLGLLVAILLPQSVPELQRRTLVQIGFTLCYSAYSIFPATDTISASFLWAGVFIATATGKMVENVAYYGRIDWSAKLNQSTTAEMLWRFRVSLVTWLRENRKFALQLAVSVIVLPVALIVAKGPNLPGVLTHAVRNDQLSIVASGFALAVFISNDVIAHVVKPYVRNLSEKGEDVSQLVPNGKYLGWLERSIIFTFIVGGQATAAALAITVKSLARLPQARKQAAFTEYYLIGTLSSVAVAAAFAILVRVSLGLSPV
jgi:hypothetical protein